MHCERLELEGIRGKKDTIIRPAGPGRAVLVVIGVKVEVLVDTDTTTAENKFYLLADQATLNLGDLLAKQQQKRE